MSLPTPVALFIFNRPDLTEVVFEAIRQAKPEKLLVVADGPRFLEETEKCNQARAVINGVDWNCEVSTNFSQKNMGCGLRVSTGLNWVFSEVNEAIILEDDCLPAPSFFYFCHTLLEYYRNDERIMHISGNNFLSGQHQTDYSYYFSKYGGIWGWASWRRAWNHFDQNMKTWPEFKRTNMIDDICHNSFEKLYWTGIFDRMIEGIIDTWDYQWLYARWSQNDLSIVPKSNLVTNIGFGLNATHTSRQSPLAQLSVNDIWEIEHPPFVIRHKLADAYTFDYSYGGKDMKTANFFTRTYQYLAFLKREIKQRV